MSLTQTTLAAAVDANATSFQATSVTGATVGGFAKIDNEYSAIVSIVGSIVNVRSRGDDGGIAIAHDILAPVTFGLFSDKAVNGAGELTPTPTEDYDVISVGQNGVIPAPVRNTNIVLNKGSALSGTTLPAPTKAQDNLRLAIIAGTAFAHVLTATGLIDDGVTGGAKGTLTFGAFVGSAIELQALNGHWVVLNKNVVTIT